ncbi:arginine deiminase [Thermovirga lienii DSM 17291]|jgi:arginine deiminase|uniref:Arginine deiminase n=1 Tax=Thermovirga lienii (strain ATCC BAA-1197 / DSM 17291 / Cas60314) TaxID=580340 RepID=G7VA75_THELD|nr:arginine deiminase [Thermovirga lienii]AER66775.1 arginine deiminase [Thermovirga lienii DSM 17291]MDN5318275.1 arginine deiminase [Thermovirga sp.]MDN5367417.1 arginine deiminase [Thermovirga sp.]HCD71483.1 arginine deiminase [Thermovirga lienii]
MKEKSAAFSVTSEIGRLKRVMLHRPGRELERLTIDNKDNLLFDDILWVEEAQKEHDAFADLLRDNGVEVVYFKNCLSHILKDENIRKSLLEDVIALEALDIPLSMALLSELMAMPSDELAEILIAGLTKKEALQILSPCTSLVLNSIGDYDFLIRPVPNLYFQRDPYSFVQDGVVVSVMNFEARKKEPLYAKYIFENHPYFKGLKIFYGTQSRDTYPYHIEGGDVLVLSDKVVAIGISQRTSAGTVQIVGSRLARSSSVKTILAFDIPKTRAAMHLDTVFTMVDRDAFTVYPGLSETLRIWELNYEEDGTLTSIKEHSSLKECIKKVFDISNVRFIETGGGDPIAAARDQWNDGTNTLALEPGVVVTYRRNVASNRALRENGIKVFEIKGAELGRGRGGPRCMSMPICRENIHK